MKEIKTTKAPLAIGPYSQAILVNNMLFISGQIPLKNNELITDYKEACHTIMHNINEILKEASLEYKDIVKTTIFINDLSFFQEVNEVYESYLVKPYPARSCVEVSKLPKGAILEIEVIAYKK